MLAVVQRAGHLAEALHDQRRVSTVCSLLAFAGLSTGQLGSAVDAGQRALAIARELDDVSLEAPANTYLGYVYTTLGEFDDERIIRDFLQRLASYGLNGDCAVLLSRGASTSRPS